MKLNSLKVFAVIMVIIFGGIYLSNLGGLWITESKKEVRTIESGELSGLPDPEDIRGSYSLGDIENNFGIPTGDIATAFGIIADDPSEFKIKDLENLYADLEGDIEIGTESVRIFVSMYMDIPFEWSGDIPSTATQVLKDKNLLSDLEESYLSDHSIDMDSAKIKTVEEAAVSAEQTEKSIGESNNIETTASDESISNNEVSTSNNEESSSNNEESVVAEEEHVQGEDAPAVNGKTTVKDLINSGIAESDIIDLIGPYANENMLLRDICSDNGVSFSEAKTKFTEMLEGNQ